MSNDEENAYFRQKEMERREDKRRAMEKAAKELQEARGVAKAAGTEDMELAARIHALGFSGETAMVFDLMPLVHVAWADGKVQRAERATILTVLEHRNIARDSEAFVAIEAMLEEQPSEAFMAESLAALRDLMADRPEGDTTEMIELCAAVADASGGILGLARRVSGEERELIAKIADGLGSVAQEQFRKSL